MNSLLFNYIFRLSENPFIAKFALFLSYPFTYLLVALLFIWIIFVSKRKMFNFSLFFLSIFFSWLTAVILKNILQVSRPFITENVIPLYKETGFSFPSEHMAVFTAIAVCMFLVNKKAGVIFSVIAIFIGLSRIIIGVHYPLDILGGLFVGLIISLITRKIYKKI